jgi:hypothetical protein
MAKRVERKLEKLKEEYIERVRAYITPIVRAEFKRAQRKNPKLQGITFGMGDYAMRGFSGFDRYYYSDYDRAPNYMRRLIELCDLANEFWIEDID